MISISIGMIVMIIIISTIMIILHHDVVVLGPVPLQQGARLPGLGRDLLEQLAVRLGPGAAGGAAGARQALGLREAQDRVLQEPVVLFICLFCLVGLLSFMYCLFILLMLFSPAGARR